MLIVYLRVLHYTFDAVKVGKITDRFIGVVQHSSNCLKKEKAAKEITGTLR